MLTILHLKIYNCNEVINLNFSVENLIVKVQNEHRELFTYVLSPEDIESLKNDSRIKDVVTDENSPLSFNGNDKVFCRVYVWPLEKGSKDFKSSKGEER